MTPGSACHAIAWHQPFDRCWGRQSWMRHGSHPQMMQRGTKQGRAKPWEAQDHYWKVKSETTAASFRLNGEKGLRKGKKIAFHQISEERHSEAFQFTLGPLDIWSWRGKKGNHEEKIRMLDWGWGPDYSEGKEWGVDPEKGKNKKKSPLLWTYPFPPLVCFLVPRPWSSVLWAAVRDVDVA